ncbi:hypothetical protein B0H19DRAFT_1063177 [Mycena capillaripes]|nr:hypothetical protein B0H19DRAFT_1063177 [Mycena capillaripes]
MDADPTNYDFDYTPAPFSASEPLNDTRRPAPPASQASTASERAHTPDDSGLDPMDVCIEAGPDTADDEMDIEDCLEFEDYLAGDASEDQHVENATSDFLDVYAQDGREDSPAQDDEDAQVRAYDNAHYKMDVILREFEDTLSAPGRAPLPTLAMTIPDAPHNTPLFLPEDESSTRPSSPSPPPQEDFFDDDEEPVSAIPADVARFFDLAALDAEAEAEEPETQDDIQFINDTPLAESSSQPRSYPRLPTDGSDQDDAAEMAADIVRRSNARQYRVIAARDAGMEIDPFQEVDIPRGLTKLPFQPCIEDPELYSQKRMGTASRKAREADGEWGYVIMPPFFNPNKTDTHPKMGVMASNLTIPVTQLRLQRTIYEGHRNPDRHCIADAEIRVIVIGPDLAGSDVHIGRYAQTIPSELRDRGPPENRLGEVVHVKFAIDPDAAMLVPGKALFPLYSLCRSVNTQPPSAKDPMTSIFPPTATAIPPM